jgi:hypothetical protein
MYCVERNTAKPNTRALAGHAAGNRLFLAPRIRCSTSCNSRAIRRKRNLQALTKQEQKTKNHTPKYHHVSPLLHRKLYVQDDTARLDCVSHHTAKHKKKTRSRRVCCLILRIDKKKQRTPCRSGGQASRKRGNGTDSAARHGVAAA